MKMVYDTIVQPAAITIAPRAIPDTDHFWWPRIWIYVPQFGIEVRHLLGQQPWGQQAFFLTNVCGHKDASCHDAQPQNKPDEVFITHSEHELARMTAGLDLDMLSSMDSEEESCYVDIGIEVTVPGHTVCWQTDGHEHMVQMIIPGWMERECHHRTQWGYDRYRQDLLAQFTDISGFRLEPVAWHNTHSITYLNVYHTEKQLTYQLAGRSVTKELGADVILNSKAPDGGSKWFQGMYSLYGEAAQKKFSGAAHFEAWLPIWHVHSVLCTLPLQSLLWATLVIPADILCRTVVGSLASKEMSLALRAAALWMMNALNSRPKDDPTFKALADYVLPHMEDGSQGSWAGARRGEEGDGNEIERFSYMPFGMFMTRALVLQPETDCPRLEYSPWRCISRDHWPFLLKYDLQTLCLKTSKIQLIAERHPDHVPWSTCPTGLIEEPLIHGGADDSFNLDDLREALLGGGYDHVNDLPWAQQTTAETKEMGEMLKEIWWSFPRDLLVKAPGVKGGRGAHI
ncbi:uncharacterized protein EI90DRAFT_3022918 [Cantharellus anzutake]|uniref:uncharacterized protein n=1 Tax=Cantharellus anzutake TaxID=1750568 RepID=UPI001907EA6A|nr:uncharacterized protein EI90DRAFT_3022918 [Cantharellus anzutake]KAF8312596.1 hypothetical protein EI90DRAFT_3022918 [Cantharellus anzutake]